MNIIIINEDFLRMGSLESMESLIWTERYSKCGDFEIYTPYNKIIYDLLKSGTYIWNEDSEEMMVIEDIEITTDAETGVHLKVSGRSLESLLDRRIIWKQTVLTGNVQEQIKKILDENVISPEDESRKIENFVFQETTNEEILDTKIDVQFTGDTVYDAIVSICEGLNLGFSLLLNENRELVFKLYKGTDRSYDQNKNQVVLFSPKFDNLLNSEYLESTKNLKTITLVAGEGEGSARKTVVVEAESGALTGLKRRELFTDARDISSTTESGTLTADKYNDLLKKRGQEKLEENSGTKASSGDITEHSVFQYGRDFFKGDIVQIVNEYGMSFKVRITEVIQSQDSSGYNIYPTFVNA